MSTIDNGGPAFPCQHEGSTRSDAAGMTLRDYFAVHAAEGDILCQAEIIRSGEIQKYGLGILPDGWRVMARYMHADAMLEARK